MQNILDYHFFYFVGIKGVAMTSLAQCILDAGKSVRGSDVAEKFVTQHLLDQRQVQIDESFDVEIPSDVECVVYTSAHQSHLNPQVQAARQRNIPTLTHAEALAQIFNLNQGIAVCGVGGKSTTSAMIAWILEKLQHKPNYAIGVGDIPGLGKTGQWRADATYFVAEADEYVTDPSAPSRGEEITPRFSFLKPFTTVCTNMRHDHPDVYTSFDETKKHFTRFFNQIQSNGFLIANIADKEVFESMSFWPEANDRKVIWFGTVKQSQQIGSGYFLDPSTFIAKDGQTRCALRAPHLGEEAVLQLQLPGLYNLQNATAAVAACVSLGISFQDAVQALSDFRSTLRRCQFIGEKAGVKYYDDYGHHPHEVANVIHAYREWFPDRKLIIGFQSHTFSRTKQFFTEFIHAFKEANEVAMIDIFPSAREAFDSSVTSDQLCSEIEQHYPTITAKNYKTLPELAEYCKTQLKPGDVFVTVGAGDIYQVHDLVS